jgi:riboflavin kinase/FMN adenylyltransferase
MEKLGVQILIYNSFNLKIARCSPEQFVQQILIDRLRVKEVFVGFNYTFGYKGAGTPELLRQLGEKQGFKVNIIPPVEVDGMVVSSSMIRQALETGDIGQARIMLGYEPMLEGQVIEGEHRGSTIGIPTANLGLSHEVSIPGRGVYAARAEVNGRPYQAVVNIGSKPTFHAEYPVAIEAHLIDFKGNIYGDQLRLYFIEKIRDERKFNDVQELIRQINLDRDKARRIVPVP